MIYFLILLIFISKISFAFLGFFPAQIEPFIYQYGMHPYVNLIFNLILAGYFLPKWLLNNPEKIQQQSGYKYFIFLICFYLIVITSLQSIFVNKEESFLMQMGSALMAVFTIIFYGRVIPFFLTPKKFIQILTKISVFICIISLIILLVSPETAFKGSRFIGVFKHIPHMVSCATIACFGLFLSIFQKKTKQNLKPIFDHFILVICFFTLILTGTRSAVAAVIVGYIFCLILFKVQTNAVKFLKVTFAITSLLVILFFGDKIIYFTYAVVTGEESIGQRAAQDGLKSRLEEIERGYEIFQKNEFLGQGILSKFSNGHGADVSGYNANKDPHNIFISAGVIGGWGFIFLTTFGIIGLIGMTLIKVFKSQDEAEKIIAIYLLTHIPIIIIYHFHLSLGGIADRIFWMTFGYMAIISTNGKLQNNLN